MKDCIKCNQQCKEVGYVSDLQIDHGHAFDLEVESFWVCMNEECVYYGLVQIGKEKA
jgi:hypothetical protein